jgi:regulator of sigma E protease
MDFLVVLVFFSILIIVHEWGHFITAKSLGVKVEVFSIGFGKKIISRKSNGTEFAVCAVPLGGYVKMAGDDRTQCTGTKDEFYSHSIWHRALIIAMGPIVNFVFAYLCFYFVFVTGFPTATPNVGGLMDGRHAQVSGFQTGDRILQIDDKDITDWDEISEEVSSSKGRALKFVIQRGDDTIVKEVIPERHVSETIFGTQVERWIIGIQNSGDTVLLKYGFGESFFLAFDRLVNIATMTLKALYYVIIGAMPAKDAFAGPIVIFDIIQDALRMGIVYLVLTMAIISESLAIINLFPIPVLDGGHLSLLLIEKIRRKPLSLKVEEGLTKLGFSLLMCLMLFVFYNDFARKGWIDSMKHFVEKIFS